MEVGVKGAANTHMRALGIEAPLSNLEIYASNDQI